MAYAMWLIFVLVLLDISPVFNTTDLITKTRTHFIGLNNLNIWYIPISACKWGVTQKVHLFNVFKTKSAQSTFDINFVWFEEGGGRALHSRLLDLFYLTHTKCGNWKQLKTKKKLPGAIHLSNTLKDCVPVKVPKVVQSEAAYRYCSFLFEAAAYRQTVYLCTSTFAVAITLVQTGEYNLRLCNCHATSHTYRQVK